MVRGSAKVLLRGISSKQRTSGVRVSVSVFALGALHITYDFSDSPEIAPGALIDGSNPPTTGLGPTGTNFHNPTHFPGVTAPATSLPTGSSLPLSGDPGDAGLSTGVSSHTAAIVGGVVGGGAAIAIAFILFGLIYRQRQRPTLPSAPYMVDVASPPLYYSQRPLSDAGTPTQSSMVDTHVVPMRAYVCFFVPPWRSLQLNGLVPPGSE